jgi:hypothetical protein
MTGKTAMKYSNAHTPARAPPHAGVRKKNRGIGARLGWQPQAAGAVSEGLAVCA